MREKIGERERERGGGRKISMQLNTTVSIDNSWMDNTPRISIHTRNTDMLLYITFIY